MIAVKLKNVHVVVRNFCLVNVRAVAYVLKNLVVDWDVVIDIIVVFADERFVQNTRVGGIFNWEQAMVQPCVIFQKQEKPGYLFVAVSTTKLHVGRHVV